jgi:hypothetical protein
VDEAGQDQWADASEAEARRGAKGPGPGRAITVPGHHSTQVSSVDCQPVRQVPEGTATHSNARARLPGPPHARAASAMAGIASSAADAAPEPEGHGAGDDGIDGDDNTFAPLLDLVERFPDLFAQKVLAHLDPIDRTFLAQTRGACRAAVAASDLPRAGTRRVVLGRSVWVVTHTLGELRPSSGWRGPRATAARGLFRHVRSPHLAGMWRSCNGREIATARGMAGCVKRPLGAGT